MSEIDELLQFLDPTSVPVAKGPAVCYLLGMTATEDGLKLFRQPNGKFLAAFGCLVREEKQPTIRDKAFEVLVNLSSHEDLAARLIDCTETITVLLSEAIDIEKPNVQRACAILSNLSQTESNAGKLWPLLQPEADKLLLAFCSNNDKDFLQDHIGFLFSNVTVLKAARSWFMDRQHRRVEKLFPFMTLETTATRKHGAIGTIRNCTFDTDHHQWLLEDVAILSRLLFPLIGPEVGENLDEEDMEQLPLDCQYLGNEKRSDPNPDIRKMLIEALHQMVATRFGRKFFKANGVYFVLRELHKVEKNKSVLIALENLVDVLIQDEPDCDNLKEVEIPEELIEKFEKMDKTFWKIKQKTTVL